MAKTFDVCRVCKAKKFLNSLGLCKRCCHTPEGLKVMRVTITKQHELFEAEQEAEAQAAEQAAQEEAAEESAQEGEETSQEGSESKEDSEDKKE